MWSYDMEEGGGGITYLEVAKQLGKFLEVPTPIIMYGQWSYDGEGGGGLKIVWDIRGV